MCLLSFVCSMLLYVAILCPLCLRLLLVVRVCSLLLSAAGDGANDRADDAEGRLDDAENHANISVLLPSVTGFFQVSRGGDRHPVDADHHPRRTPRNRAVCPRNRYAGAAVERWCPDQPPRGGRRHPSSARHGRGHRAHRQHLPHHPPSRLTEHQSYARRTHSMESSR